MDIWPSIGLTGYLDKYRPDIRPHIFFVDVENIQGLSENEEIDQTFNSIFQAEYLFLLIYFYIWTDTEYEKGRVSGGSRKKMCGPATKALSPQA